LKVGLHTYLPDQHFYQLFPHKNVERVFCTGQFISPSPLGNVCADPSKFVATIIKQIGGWFLGKIILVAWSEIEHFLFASHIYHLITLRNRGHWATD
jgi:hypothetical protein